MHYLAFFVLITESIGM